MILDTASSTARIISLLCSAENPNISIKGSQSAANHAEQSGMTAQLEFQQERAAHFRGFLHVPWLLRRDRIHVRHLALHPASSPATGCTGAMAKKHNFAPRATEFLAATGKSVLIHFDSNRILGCTSPWRCHRSTPTIVLWLRKWMVHAEFLKPIEGATRPSWQFSNL